MRRANPIAQALPLALLLAAGLLAHTPPCQADQSVSLPAGKATNTKLKIHQPTGLDPSSNMEGNRCDCKSNTA